MKYHQIIALLSEEPLLITGSAWSSIMRLFEEHRNLSAEEFRAAREGVDMCGEDVELEQMEIIDGLAFIPVVGPIGKGLGKFEKGAGATDVQDVMDELDQAEDDPEVRGIILCIDSPGGMVSGTPELADRIASVDKPIYAFTSGMMCSAAYWIAAACDGIFATKSADIGSIGVYVPFLDQSKRYENAGLKVEVISSGKYKGAGVPGTSLSADHRKAMETRISDIAEMFFAHVEANRPDSSRDDMQGQVFKAEAAMRKGLIDGVVRDRDEVASLLGS